MIRYFKLAYDIIINNILFNLLIILEVTGMLVLTNTVIASYNSKQMLYLPYKDILHEKGVVFAAYGHEILEFSENKDVQAIPFWHEISAFDVCFFPCGMLYCAAADSGVPACRAGCEDSE